MIELLVLKVFKHGQVSQQWLAGLYYLVTYSIYSKVYSLALVRLSSKGVMMRASGKHSIRFMGFSPVGRLECFSLSLNGAAKSVKILMISSSNFEHNIYCLTCVQVRVSYVCDGILFEIVCYLFHKWQNPYLLNHNWWPRLLLLIFSERFFWYVFCFLKG